MLMGLIKRNSTRDYDQTKRTNRVLILVLILILILIVILILILILI